MKLITAFFLSIFSFQAYSATNFCQGKAAGTYYCVDDTKMQHCTGSNGFVMKACPAKLCVTRTPAERNPCVGREAATREDGVSPPVVAGGEVVNPQPSAPNPKPTVPTPPIKGGEGGDGVSCIGGPKFDPAGQPNFENFAGQNLHKQFIGGRCVNNGDCASFCCSGPCGICSGVGAQFQAGKTGCGFGG